MIEDCTQHLAVLTVSLHIPAAQSLKQKRAVLKSMKERVRRKHNVSVAELGGQDKWQVAVLGVAMIGNDRKHVDRSLQSVVGYIENFPGCDLCEHKIEFS